MGFFQAAGICLLLGLPISIVLVLGYFIYLKVVGD